MNDVWKAIQALIVELKPFIESLFIGVLTAAITGGLSYLADSAGTFTMQSLLAGMLAGALDWLTSKARHNELKAVKADAEKQIKSVTEPEAGNTNF